MVYACFVVRSHFLSEAEDNLAYSGVLLSRAAVCEILAMKLLGTFASSPLRVATVLTASWNPLAGAPEQVINDVRNMVGEDGTYDPQCALEVCISYTYVCHFSDGALVLYRRWPLLPNRRRFLHPRSCRRL